MADGFFNEVPERIRFGGLASTEPLAYKVYDPDRLVLGKRMEDHLRPGVCFWHSFAWPGVDMFGARDDGSAVARRLRRPDGRRPDEDGRRPSSSSRRSASRSTASTTGTSRPKARRFAEFRDNLDALADDAAGYQERTGVRLLWGTANLFTHPRYQAGAATNPDPEVFAYAAAQVKHMLEVTQRLGGENYVLWGGREGYDTLLNTDLAREGAQLARFLHLVAEHKHRIGFERPAPDRAEADGADQAPVRLRRRRRSTASSSATGSRTSTASTSRPTTRRWPATASTTRSRSPSANGILGSIDANRGDPQNGWDTDQFPNSVEDLALPLYEILRGRWHRARRLQLRRQAAPPEQRSDRPVPRPHRRPRHARPGAARGGRPDRARTPGRAARGALRGLERRARERRSSTAPRRWHRSRRRSRPATIDPRPVSGRQELLENVVNQSIWAAESARVETARPLSGGPRPRDRRLDDGDQGRPRRRDGRGPRRRRRPSTASASPRPLWSEQDPAALVGRRAGGDRARCWPRAGAHGGGRRRGRADRPDARAGAARRRPTASCGRRSCGTTSARPPSATRSARRSGRSG